MKLLKTILAILMILLMNACTSREAVKIEELRIMYAPLADVDDILSATAELSFQLRKAMSEKGVDVDKITVTVASSFDDAALSLVEGRCDIAWLPAVTYCQYSDRLSVLAAGTMGDVTVSSEKLSDWNSGFGLSDKTTPVYRCLVITGNSAISEKVKNGEKLKWEDVENLTWAISSSKYSPDGFMALAQWLSDEFGKSIQDIRYLRVSDSQSFMPFNRVNTIETGEADITVVTPVGYIFSQVIKSTVDENGIPFTVIGVTEKYAYDPICYNSSNETMKIKRVRQVLLEVLTELADVYSYGYEGIAEVKESQYRELKKALDIINTIE